MTMEPSLSTLNLLICSETMTYVYDLETVLVMELIHITDISSYCVGNSVGNFRQIVIQRPAALHPDHVIMCWL